MMKTNQNPPARVRGTLTLTLALGALSLAALAAWGGPPEGTTAAEVVAEADALLDTGDWELVGADELARAKEDTQRSLRAALGAELLLFNGDRVYRMRDARRFDLGETVGYPGTDEAEPSAEGIGRAHSAIIVGQDNRVPITSGLTNAPQRHVGRITTGMLVSGQVNTLNGLAGGGCSGTKIGNRGVLTSGHCFKSLTDAVRFEPAVSGPSSPFPALISQTFFVYGTGDTDDYALVILPGTRQVYSLGFTGLYAPSSSWDGKSIELRGYPGANQICWTAPLASLPLCGGYMYRSSCSLTEVDQELEYPCDTTGGMSGSGVMTWVNGARRVIGVHKGKDDDAFDNENRAVRMTSFKVTLLCAVMAGFGGGCN